MHNHTIRNIVVVGKQDTKTPKAGGSLYKADFPRFWVIEIQLAVKKDLF